MDDLIAFLNARLDEAAAKKANGIALAAAVSILLKRGLETG